MNPELERLVDALYQAETCPPSERASWLKRYDRWFAEMATKLHPGYTEEQLQIALLFQLKQRRLREARQAHAAKLPPKA